MGHINIQHSRLQNKDKEKHFIMTKRPFHLGRHKNPECVGTSWLSKTHKVKLIKLQREIGKSTNIVSNSNTSLSTIARRSRQKICKSSEYLNNTINHLELTWTYKTCHPTALANPTFISSALGTFEIHHILDHHISLNKI